MCVNVSLRVHFVATGPRLIDCETAWRLGHHAPQVAVPPLPARIDACLGIPENGDYL